MMIQKIGLWFVVAWAITACAVVPNAGTGTDSGAHPSITVSDAMLVDVVAPVDTTFMAEMIAHHDAAIVMARQALAYSDRRELHTMAATIIETQRVENRRMQTWFSEWYPDQFDAATASSDPSGMAGNMISDDASRPFDLRFLDAMIAHQEQAIQMAQEADGNVEHSQLQTLIKSIIVQQGNDLDRMKNWQQEWSQG